MRKLYPLSTLVLLAILLLNGIKSYSQDFSNKGREFWLCFPTHVPSSNNATLSIYITSDQASSGTISMPNGAFFATFNIPANGIQQIPIPWNANIHIANGESNTVLNKSINIKCDPGKPAVVAYAQQWAGARSAATLLLPVNVLGRKYYAMSFTQNGANNGSFLARSQFQIIAVKPNTQVKITPMKNGAVQPSFTVTLPNIGDLYQYQSTDPTAATQDLTGTLIESIAASSGGCLPIAVFSGSSNITFGTPTCSGNSYDPIWQQCYPVSTWGKNFGFVPFRDYFTGVPYRVLASENDTKVYFDGTFVATLNAGEIYPASFTSNPPVLLDATSISADKPICVAEYAQADVCTGQSAPRVGDPDMVLLNPIEQNIKDITIFTSPNQAITRQYINVVIPTVSTNTFTINGAPPGSPWIAFPALAGYSYLRHQLPGAGAYRLTADTGFNAICYGWGNVESYSYSAGTNVRDLYQQIGVSSQYGVETTPAVCRDANFKFKVSLPYCADSIFWDLSQLPGPPVPPTQMVNYTSCVAGAGGPDSTTVINGITLYWYSLPGTYNINTSGIFPVTITVYKSTADDCGNEQEIAFELTVYDPPVPEFTFTGGECPAVPVQFTDATTSPRPSYIWNWNFGDPASGANNTSNLQNPVHTFSGPGTYTVSFSTITTPGCVSNVITHNVTIPDLPTASIASPANVCVNGTADVTFTGVGTAPFTFYYNINGGPALSVNSAAGPPASSTATVPVNTTTAGTFVYTIDSIRTVGSTACVRTITGQSVTITVQPDHAIALSSAAGTDNQQVCLNAAITPITYTLSGGATGANVIGLPAGVNFSVAGTTLTISGAPTTAVGSPFSFTITTSGNACAQATLGGTITVNPDHTITLTSAASTTNQSACINTAIANITYTLGGGATGATVAGLPTGVTFSVAGNTLTISGTPTTLVGSPFNFTITTTGNNCLTATSNGTITVNPAHAITLSSAAGSNNQTVCLNIPITPITYTLSGGATGANVSGLPTGVTFSVSGNTLTISGTPSTAVGSPFNFSVTTTGNPCAGANASGTLTVGPDHAIALTSAAGTANQSACINTAIVNITYTLSGGATGATVTGLPPGVTSSVAGTTLTISGTPTSSAGSPYNYSITTTGNNCVVATANGTITVTPAHAIALSSAAGTNSQNVCVNNAIVNITYTLSGGATGATVIGLPAGVTFSVSGNTLTISGTPTTTTGSPFNYNITTSGNPCAGATASGTITVNSDHVITLSSAASTTNQTACINTAIVNITYTLSGGATGATVLGLPAGVTSSVAGNTLTISGSPTTTAGSPFNYTITTTGNSCLTANANGTITVNPVHAVALSSAAGTNSQTVCVNNAIVNITYTLSGGATGATVIGLPAGVTSSVAGNTVTISGTPTTAVGSPFNFTVNTTGNTCLSASANGTITVNADHAVTLSSAAGTNNQSVCINTAATTITYTLSGGATGATVAGLPPGMTSSVAGNTVTISGTATSSAGSPYNYSVTTTGNGCVVATANGTITVTPAHSVTLSSAAGTNNQTVCVNTALNTITYTLGGGASNATVTGLPAGVTSSVAGNTLTISGTPTTTAGSPFNYTINTSGNSCAPAVANGTITVAPDHTLNLTSAASTANQTVCLNAPIVNITYSLGGGATGATVSGLPPGVNSSVAGGVVTISGSPSSLTGSPFNYTITTTGNACIVASANGSITVEPAHVMSLSSAAGTTNQTVCVNNAITAITYSLSGGATGATVTGLPAGVSSSVAGNTLTISGTPTAAGTFNYSVVTTGNSCTTASANGTLTVNPDHVLSLTSPAATTNQSVCTERAMTSITYSINGGATGATVTGLPPGVTSSVVGNILTISGSPTSVAGSPYNYTVTTTGNGCVTATATGTLTTLLTPTVQLDAVPGRCADQPSFQMTASPAGGVFSGPGVNSTGLFNPAVSGAGDHIIRYTYTAANGCENFSEQTVGIYPMPIVDAGPDKGIIEGGQIALTPNITANFPVTYSWVPAQYLSNPNIANPIVSGIPDDQTYTLTVTSDKGCSASDQVFVKLLRRIEIPNIFSPNGDGIHDRWEIQYLESYPGCTVVIYNRYGQKIFQSEGYSKPWDGMSNGKPVPVGTYYYIINPKNGRSQMAGYVDVIR